MSESPQINYQSFDDILADGDISEIMVNGPKQIYVERAGTKILANFTFKDEQALQELIRSYFKPKGRRISVEKPYGDMTLPDGSRINTILPPLAKQGSILTIRKFMKTVASVDDLMRWGTLSRAAADLLIACVQGRLNIFFSGGTGVGKTTTLQILSEYIDPNERMIVIEDTSELRPVQDHVVNLETRAADDHGKGIVTLRDLIHNALRMRPDRLILGEARGGEVLDILNAMLTGHDGCLGVVHGSSPYDVLARMETMALMSGVQLPLLEIRKMLTSTINIIVHQERMQDGSKKITYITEIEGMSKDSLHEIRLHDLFRFHFDGVTKEGKVKGTLKSVIRHYPKFFTRLEKMGFSIADVFKRDSG